ncbi:hypothetical protein ACWD2L_00350 [Streptomyces sp. NPDC002754]
MKPTVCRAVHFVAYGSLKGTSRCRAAVITEVHGRATDPITLDDTGPWNVALTVFHPNGWTIEDVCLQDEAPDGDHRPGSWHWPERVGE